MKNISDYEGIHSVNPFYFIIGEIDGYLEESNGNKNLNFSFTDKKRSIDKIHRTLGWD